ncbi:MAG: hypothetical protein K5750_02670, partial [Eubacterium sp.]|nr:hypothetical protein [Eubacterium sp.]
MKKSSKKRSLCFVLALMLSIGFCLAGIPAKRAAADGQIGGNKPFDEKTFLMVGDDIIIKGGQWNADLGEKLKGSGDDTYYEDEGGHFIIQKYYIGGDYSDVILTFTQDGGHCGGIILDCIKLQFGGMTQEVLDEDEHNQDDHTYTFTSMIDAVTEQNATTATNTNIAINEHYSGFNDAMGYSVYCASGGFEFNYSLYHVGRASFQYNLAGGIRYGGSSGVKISGDTIVNIGTETQASSTGISNVDCGGKTRYTPPENDHYFYIAGELNIIANWIFRDVDFVYVEGG